MKGMDVVVFVLSPYRFTEGKHLFFRSSNSAAISGFSRNSVWVILSLYDTFHAETSYSKVGFTLNQLSFVLPAVVLSCSFRDRKEPKGPGTGQNQS